MLFLSFKKTLKSSLIESSFNIRGLLFIGIAFAIIFTAFSVKSSTKGEPTTWPVFVQLLQEGKIIKDDKPS